MFVPAALLTLTVAVSGPPERGAPQAVSPREQPTPPVDISPGASAPSERDEAPPADECTRTWRVRVLDSDEDEGIPGATVVVQSPRDAAPRYSKTDDAGWVTLYALCPAPTRVRVSKADHETQEVEVDPGQILPASIELRALHGHHSVRVIVVHDDEPTTTGASETVSGSKLSRTRGQGLSDSLEGVSGVRTLRGPAGGMGKPVIRGQVGRRTAILVDGVRHEGQAWGLDHAPEVDPYAASRLTVIKGAATTRYGAEAIGGVVLVDPRPLPRTPGVNGEVSTVGVANALGGGGSARLDLAPARARGLALRVDANVSRHRAALTPDYALDNTGASTWNTGTRMGWLSDHVDVEVGYRLMRSVLGICSCLRVSSAEDFAAAIARGRPIDVDLYRADFAIERPRQEVWHHLALARGRVALGNAGELHLTYAFQFDDRREYDTVRNNVAGPQLVFGLATHSVDVDWEHAAKKVGRGDLLGDLGVQVGQQTNEFTAATSLIPDYRQGRWAVFDVERLVFERIEIEFGARYEGLHRQATLSERDYLGQLAGGRLDDERCRAEGEGGLCRRTYHAPSAMVGLLGRPARRAPELIWRGQLHSSGRIPSIDEQFMNGSSPSFPLLGIGDSRLGVERSWGGETTLQYAKDWLFVEGAAFGNYVDNYIYFVPQPAEGQCAPLTCTARGPFPLFAFVPTDAAVVGGEARIDLRAPRLPFGVSADGAWVRGYELDSGRQLVFTPADRYTLAGRYYIPDSRLSARGYVELNSTIVARRRGVDPALDFAAPPPAYGLVGAAVGIDVLGRREIHRFSLVGTNLLNARYRDYNSLLRYFVDEPGWSVALRYAIEFDTAFGSEHARRRGRPRPDRPARARV